MSDDPAGSSGPVSPVTQGRTLYGIRRRRAQKRARARLRRECWDRYRALYRDFRAAYTVSAAESRAMTQLVREYRGTYRSFYAEELAALTEPSPADRRSAERRKLSAGRRAAGQQRWLRELEEFVSANGRLPAAGSRLYSWLARVKSGRTSLPDGLRARVDELVRAAQDASLARRAETVSQRLGQVERFVGEHGRMPGQFRSGEQTLYWWFIDYRQAQWLPDGLRARVDALAAVAAAGRAARMLAADLRRLEKFEAFVDEHSRMPRLATEETICRWVSLWQEKPERLPEQAQARFRRALERAQAGDRETREAAVRARHESRHEAWIGEFEGFFLEHCRLPGTQGPAGEKALYQWAARWRRRPDWPAAVRARYERLVEAAQAGEAAQREAEHQRQLAKLTAFTAEHGRLPQAGTDGEEGKLAAWLQRGGGAGPPPAGSVQQGWDRAAVARENALARRVPEFEAFVRVHGRLPRAGVPDERSLYQWWLKNADRQDWPPALRARFDAARAAAEGGREP